MPSIAHVRGRGIVKSNGQLFGKVDPMEHCLRSDEARLCLAVIAVGPSDPIGVCSMIPIACYTAQCWLHFLPCAVLSMLGLTLPFTNAETNGCARQVQWIEAL